jgi:hypothetical protein
MLSKALGVMQCSFVLMHAGGLLTTTLTIPDRLEFRNGTNVCWRIGVNNGNGTDTGFVVVVFYHHRIHEPNDQPLSILSSKGEERQPMKELRGHEKITRISDFEKIPLNRNIEKIKLFM